MKSLVYLQSSIGLWCNGNTPDSGPDILGSNPSSPTKKVFELTQRPFL